MLKHHAGHGAEIIVRVRPHAGARGNLLKMREQHLNVLWPRGVLHLEALLEAVSPIAASGGPKGSRDRLFVETYVVDDRAVGLHGASRAHGAKLLKVSGHNRSGRFHANKIDTCVGREGAQVCHRRAKRRDRFHRRPKRRVQARAKPALLDDRDVTPALAGPLVDRAAKRALHGSPRGRLQDRHSGGFHLGESIERRSLDCAPWS